MVGGVHVTQRARLSARSLFRREAAGIDAGQFPPYGTVGRRGPYRPEAGEPRAVRGDQHGGRADPRVGQVLPVRHGEVLGQREGERPDRPFGQRAAVHGESQGQRKGGPVGTRVPRLLAGAGQFDGREDTGPEEMAGGVGLGHEALRVDRRQGVLSSTVRSPSALRAM